MKQLILSIILSLVCVTGTSFAQTRVDRSVLAGGAMRAGGTTHTINGTIGQPVIGIPKVAAHQGSFGFWYGKENISVRVERIPAARPTMATLEQNYPNPVFTTTAIRFSLPSARHIRLTLTDEVGRAIADLADGLFDGGSYQTQFAIGDLPAGSYFYRLQAGEQILARRMTVVR